MKKTDISFNSLNIPLKAVLFLPESKGPSPVLLLCHGAGEYKENYFELAEFLTGHGIASLAFDFHGHGESGGERSYVDMREWVADIRAALDHLSTRPELDPQRISAFGLSSGGTAIFEAALVEPRLKSLVALDSTVRDSFPFIQSLAIRFLDLLGRLKKALTGKDLRVDLGKLSGEMQLASDPQVNHQVESDPRSHAFSVAFPFPGATQCFIVDTITRVHAIKIPTLVLWGEEDKVDPPETARKLFAALTCEKELHIIPGNGHVGHLDRNKQQVFDLAKEWITRHG